MAYTVIKKDGEYKRIDLRKKYQKQMAKKVLDELSVMINNLSKIKTDIKEDKTLKDEIKEKRIQTVKVRRSVLYYCFDIVQKYHLTRLGYENLSKEEILTLVDQNPTLIEITNDNYKEE